MKQYAIYKKFYKNMRTIAIQIQNACFLMAALLRKTRTGINIRIKAIKRIPARKVKIALSIEKLALLQPYLYSKKNKNQANVQLSKKEMKMSFFNHHLQKELTKKIEAFASSAPLSRQEVDDYWVEINQLQILSQVQISNIDYNGMPNPLDESITVRNRGGLTINISGWRTQAGSPNQTYIFPEGSYLLPYESLCVDTTGNSEHSFNSNKPIWNNRGDIGTLIDDEGQTISNLAYGNRANRKIIISHINYDGKEHRSEGDEFIEISNISEDDVMLSDWCLEVLKNNNAFLFPKGTKLEAYTSLKVFTNKANLEYNEFSFNSPKAILNNSGGGCKLLDYLDNEISCYHY